MRGGAAVVALVWAGLWAGPWAGPAAAGVIERECLSAPRAGGDRALCACVQRVADATLTPRDQREVARFLRDPDRAEQARRRDDPAAEAFWARFTAFGDAAERSCAPGG